MREQTVIFLNAVMYLTRIPCPKNLPYSQDHLDRAMAYFPLVGWIVGAAGAASFWIAQCVLPKSTSILTSMATTVVLTGAFHEDGFTDFCDGFGGGWTKEKILAIMKDSRVGAFGVIGIVLLLAIKFSLLLEMDSTTIALTLLLAHALSRFFAMGFFFTLSYAKENEDGKAKPIARNISSDVMLMGAAFGIAPLLFFRDWSVWLMLLPLVLVHHLLGKYFEKWIGGYTGDCLGAAQQISEVLIYLFVVSWKSI